MENGVTYEVSSAENPRSNGESEAGVKRIKNAIKHAVLSGNCPRAAGTKAWHVKDALDLFSTQYGGPPHTLTTDGGKNFDSQGVRDWAMENGVTYEVSSAENPRSNGESEAGMKRIKNAIKHAVLSGNCPRACLLYTSPSPRDGLLSRMPSSA